MSGRERYFCGSRVFKMELLDVSEEYQCLGNIGPSICDVHSPNIPSQFEMEALIAKAAQAMPIERLWNRPDCDLKQGNGRKLSRCYEIW